MFRRLVVTAAIAALVIGSAPRPAAQSASTTAAMPLTVDAIMRGPALVGYPPSDLRWSSDGRELYFEWRMPGEDEAATWMVGRQGGAPHRLSDEERRRAPLANGWWDGPRRRIVGLDRGDVVVIDTTTKTRIDLTRTSAAESAPRWARGGTHVTFVRDNQVFVVPVTEVGGGALVQLVDAAPRPEPATLTDSQRTARREEQELIEWVEQAAARRARQEARDRATAPLRIDLPSASASSMRCSGPTTATCGWPSPTAARSRAPHKCRGSSRSRPTPNRSPLEPRSATRRRAGDCSPSTWPVAMPCGPAWTAPRSRAGAAAAAAVRGVAGSAAAGGRCRTAAAGREVRWTSLVPSPDGRRLVASVRSADNTDRWLVRVDPATGRSTVLDHVHDDAWVRDVGQNGSYGGGIGWLPDSRRLWFLAEHDGWMQLSTVDAAAETPARVAITSGRFEIDAVQVTPDGRQFLLQSSEVHPGERQVYVVSVDGGARTRLTTATGGHVVEVSPDGAMLA